MIPPQPEDYAVGTLLLELAGRMANALARGDQALAERWAHVASTVRGSGVYRDTDRDVHPQREVER